ncbi:hypothetical protein TREMEDRAFT_66466 [Tremella mesenterica DSM 1558]|uniref:uncharacterized protein n=1 Tax=Tremella mesenterica (strain ATCC 24925 / CBS 8224 / DSM 1558 / NBRC 9311 / NRRL Y-6157 / RJB 2259-6 / UBC 559-6) TaxID=578456 RepID=UPI00032C2587|nr:uncharacterized protein TREMEDRAFT_66466 [Tremella mesenterica DSM 1558]EIW65553.1 hypothetical protein TREMEDRAFT_66466 [Tremella mesenterica DSM 1558]
MRDLDRLIPFETVSDWAKVGLIPFETVSDWAKGQFLLRQSQIRPKVDSSCDSLRMTVKSPENSSDSPEIPQSRVVTRTWAYMNFNSTWITKSNRIYTAERTGFIPFETVSEWAEVGA